MLDVSYNCAHSHCITPNIHSVPRAMMYGQCKVVQKRKVKEVAIEGYEISIMLTQRSSSNNQDSQGQLALQVDRIDTVTKIRILQGSGARAVVMAYVHHIQRRDGSHSLNPIISVGSILPNNSEIFTIVGRGDIDQLRHLLATRQFTLRDRNASGTPLLHVGNSPLSYKTCCF
jgi:predicted oxidoreductase